MKSHLKCLINWLRLDKEKSPCNRWMSRELISIRIVEMPKRAHNLYTGCTCFKLQAWVKWILSTFGQRPQRGHWPIHSHFGEFSLLLSSSPPSALMSLPPFLAAAPKGSMTFAFTHMGNFLLLLLLHPPPLNPSLEAKIWVSRAQSQSWDPNPSLEALILA